MLTFVERAAPTINAIKLWLLRLFGQTRQFVPPQPPIHIPIVTESQQPMLVASAVGVDNFDAASIPTATHKRHHRSKTQVPVSADTFADLLESLDDTFSSLAIPSIKGNWLPKKDIRALYKMGLFIRPHDFTVNLDYGLFLPPSVGLPVLASCFLMNRKNDTADKVHARFVFALKEASLPAGVEQFNGTPYRFGVCYELPAIENDPTSPPRLFWCYAWVVVAKDGRIRVPQELRKLTQTIHHRRPRHGKREQGTFSSSYISKQWVKPALLMADQAERQEAYEEIVIAFFGQLLVWWSSRPTRWSVSVLKDGRRAVFSIDANQTASYFADRDKAISINGTAKKIIHYVKEHRRSNGSIVKAHVRGLREFDWKGYRCVVTAPDLNGILATTAPLEPVEVDAKAALVPDYLPRLEVAEFLAREEDAGYAPAKRARHQSPTSASAGLH